MPDTTRPNNLRSSIELALASNDHETDSGVVADLLVAVGEWATVDRKRAHALLDDANVPRTGANLSSRVEALVGRHLDQAKKRNALRKNVDESMALVRNAPEWLSRQLVGQQTTPQMIAKLIEIAECERNIALDNRSVAEERQGAIHDLGSEITKLRRDLEEVEASFSKKDGVIRACHEETRRLGVDIPGDLLSSIRGLSEYSAQGKAQRLAQELQAARAEAAKHDANVPGEFVKSVRRLANRAATMEQYRNAAVDRVKELELEVCQKRETVTAVFDAFNQPDTTPFIRGRELPDAVAALADAWRRWRSTVTDLRGVIGIQETTINDAWHAVDDNPDIRVLFGDKHPSAREPLSGIIRVLADAWRTTASAPTPGLPQGTAYVTPNHGAPFSEESTEDLSRGELVAIIRKLVSE